MVYFKIIHNLKYLMMVINYLFININDLNKNRKNYLEKCFIKELN